jgi:hypothetical protein
VVHLLRFRFDDVYVLIALILALLAGGVLGSLAILDRANASLSEEKRPRREKRLRRTIAEGVVIPLKGAVGTGMVELGAARTEKIRHGFMSFGAFNVLILENLSVILPEKDEDVLPSADRHDRPKDILAKMGVTGSFLKSRGANLRFSDLRIEGLEVFRTEPGGSVAPRFKAKSGCIKDGALELRECDLPDGTHVDRARLSAKGSLRLTWGGGEMEI